MLNNLAAVVFGVVFKCVGVEMGWLFGRYCIGEFGTNIDYGWGGGLSSCLISFLIAVFILE